MIKIFIYILSFLLLTAPAAIAEKISVKIAPAQIISTHHDEVELGDKIPFEVVNDVTIDGKLYIKKGTIIYGTVDFVHPNGWAGDNAEIWFKTFLITTSENKKINVDYTLKIKGNNDKANNIKQALAYYILRLIRGSEIYVEPDTKIYNLFIER